LIKGINQRLSREDALVLNKFEKLIKRKVLPNPLPIIVDKRELNKEIVKIFNDEKEPITYRQLLIKLFQKTNEKYFPDYYLFNYTNSKDGLIINDLDFVPSFHFYLNEIINNYTELSGKPSSKTISNLFEVESELNDLFVKYNNNTGKAHGFLMGNYFGDKIESQKSFKGWTVTKETLSSFYKYRESIYDFIYKSRRQSITCGMFDDMVYSAILSDINMDEYKNERHSMFYPVREKINIWFSIYNLFNNNNLIGNDMASKVTELISKMSSVAKGETNLETPEDFAFGAGQIVSYLIDRSASSNKTYAMLEPYLQKNKSNQLQDAIAQTIAIYKHDIGVYKGKFERLASQVLTDESNIEMKPLLKYFLAGCFCPCVVYEKTEKTENENNN
jgi:CRISPR-associated protein Csh1